jgi:DNA-directed RNA polymerase specialized sigma24 family protein
MRVLASAPAAQERILQIRSITTAMSSLPPIIRTDRECLEAWSRRPAGETLRPIVERYFAFVYSSALRRTGDAARAAEVARAVFLVLARRARKLRKKTVLADWLFKITAIACRKLKPKRGGRWRWLGFRARSQLPQDEALWPRVSPEIDAAVDRLPSAQRKAVILQTLLNYESHSAAQILRTPERRVRKRTERGLKRIAKRLRKHGAAVESDALASLCAAESSAAVVPEGLAPDVFKSIKERLDKAPSFQLARRTLKALAWARWRRRITIGVPSCIAVLATALGIAWYIDSLSGHSRLISAFFVWSMRHEGKTVPGLAQPARPWPANDSSPRLSATSVRRLEDLYQTTNIWLAHLKFSRDQWKALEPKRIAPLPHFFQPGRNDIAASSKSPPQRIGRSAGLRIRLGTRGFRIRRCAIHKCRVALQGQLERISRRSTDGSARSKWTSIDLQKVRSSPAPDEFNFHNLVDDRSFMSDALAYEFFRDAGCSSPAHRLRVSDCECRSSMGAKTPRPLCDGRACGRSIRIRAI